MPTWTAKPAIRGRVPRWFVVGLFLLSALLHGCAGDDAVPPDDPGAPPAVTLRALVLFDEPAASTVPKNGRLYAIMLQNLLGHFPHQVTLLAVNNYSAGTLASYDVTFYLGSYYDNALPTAFLADVNTSTKTIVWFKYNLWQWSRDPRAAFPDRFGFDFGSVRGLASVPSGSNEPPDFFRDVTYKGRTFAKYFSVDPTTQTVTADPDVGQVIVRNLTQVATPVSITNPRSGEIIPYILRSNNLWYVADVPFTFTGPRDRYLVFCDMLHEILAIPHQETHRALVRLEDIHARTDPAALETLAAYLHQERIPFAVAVTPLYRDPLGTYNGGVPLELHLSDRPGIVEALRFAQSAGDDIVMQGYTHQYDDRANPSSGVTAEDFEFWDAVSNTPVAEDSVEWALGRLDAARTELALIDGAAAVWETPHYKASSNVYAAVGQRFAARYERSFYFTAATAPGDAYDTMAGQFFPYLIERDAYGQRVIPENIGNLQYRDDVHTWEELYGNAEYALAVRDGFASFFFHPALLDPALAPSALDDFKKLVAGITALGFQWTRVRDLLPQEVQP